MVFKEDKPKGSTNDKNNNFEITVLDDKIDRRKPQPFEILSDWITNCIKVENSIEDCKSIKKILNLSEELRTQLKKIKIKKFFPVQYTVIPSIIASWNTINAFKPHDICVCAPTGSGKTLAYVVPILHLLSQSDKSYSGPRCIVVLPVRDLASQVYTVFTSLAKDIGIKCALITGYKNLVKERKDLLEQSESGTISMADVIVCTPGRLVEHIKNTPDLDLSCIQHLVIDEADRVLEDPKHDWFLTLSRHLGMGKRYKDIQSSFIQPGRMPIMQKILLSATLTRQPHLLEHFDLHLPKLFQIGARASQETSKEDFSAPIGLKEFYVVYAKEYCRIIFIVDQIRRVKMTHILCFTNTKESATRLNQLLNEFPGIRSAHLHCLQPPEIRQKLRHSLETSKLDILVTVDSMGRGMDIAGVRCVIQYEVQADVCMYIHRVGRTARAGQNGVAYALVAPKQIFHLKKNLGNCGRDIKTHKFSTGKSFKYMNEYNAALTKLQNGDESEKDGSLMNCQE